MKPAPDLTPQIHCKHEFPFSFSQCIQAFLNWAKFNPALHTPVPYIASVKQLDDDTIEVFQRFDGDILHERPAHYQYRVNRKDKELNGLTFRDPWYVSATFNLKQLENSVLYTDTLYDGQLVDKGYVDNFDVIVIQMWRYMKIKEYQERDWKEAQNILNEARDKVGSLVSENTYS